MNYLKKIVKYALPYKSYAILNIISNVFYALFGVFSFLSLIPMLQVLFERGEQIRVKPVYSGLVHIKEWGSSFLNYQITALIDQHGKLTTLMFMMGLIIGVSLLKNLANYLALFFIAFLRNGVLRDLRNDLYDKAVSLPLSYYSETRKGDMMARITSDVGAIQQSLLLVLELFVREPLTIIFTLVTMFVLSVKLTLFVFAFVPVSGFIISIIGKKLKRDSHIAQKEQGIFLSIIEETLGGLKVIKGFNAEFFFSKLFSDSTQRFYAISNKLAHRQNLASPVSEFLGTVVIAMLLWFGGRLVLVDGSLEPQVFIAYLALTYNILTPAKTISKASYAVKQANASAERVLAILETESILEDREQAKEITSFEKEIAFNNISFKYEENWILRDFNLKIPKGKTVALVGQSGSGKSTVATLLSRFYDVNEGSISIDGTDIRDFTKYSLRELMGLVTQDAILFNDTVRNNILFGKRGSTDEEIIQAAKVANAHDFIMNLPKAYDTNIGDAGGKLSGGQKQRLSIARAVLKNPPIMILDEATSALDTESEFLVQEALEYMMQHSTSLVIAHRLSTVKKADLIVVMKEGRIVEQGTHTELIAAKGSYHKLVELQEL